MEVLIFRLNNKYKNDITSDYENLMTEAWNKKYSQKEYMQKQGQVRQDEENRYKRQLYELAEQKRREQGQYRDILEKQVSGIP